MSSTVKPARAGLPAEAALDDVCAVAVARCALTARERATLHALLRGLDNRSAAAALGCGEKTVESHVTRLHAKLGVRSRLELVCACWIAWALARPRPVRSPG